MTDREKAAIKKAIPDAEKRADKYAEWVEARKHGAVRHGANCSRKSRTLPRR